MLMERIMDRRLIVPLIVLAASASPATIGCREQSAPPPPGGPNTGGNTTTTGEPVPIDATGAPVIRIDGEISDEDARALAIAALAAAQRAVLNDGTDSTSLLQLVGWRPAGRHDSGRQGIVLTYILIHPIGVEPLWSPDFQLLSTLEPLDRWAMQNLVAVGHDAKGYSLLHRNDDGTFALVSWADIRSRVLDVDSRKAEVIESSHIVMVPPVRLQARADMPTWSPLVLGPFSGERAGEDIRVFIGLSESAGGENSPDR